MEALLQGEISSSAPKRANKNVELDEAAYKHVPSTDNVCCLFKKSSMLEIPMFFAEGHSNKACHDDAKVGALSLKDDL